ncbi:MAG TPA: PQQ-binding-like beta-propeller repeat protein [Thermoguttaceae bacterium]|nr:PQQ-binding-like beta-propeller repeat protein [Thermoguttaceae bacterium]
MVAKANQTLLLSVALLLANAFAYPAELPLTATAEDDSPLRAWSDSTGSYQTEAAMVEYADGKVHLRQRDGRIIAVSVSKLSRADQRYIRQELARRKTMEKGPQSATSAATAPGDEWPGWRGRERDGKSPDQGLLKQWPAGGPGLVWQVDSIGNGFSSVAVSGGLVYITGDLDGRLILFAFDLDGRPQWKTDVDAAWTKNHPGARSAPMIDGGNLYLVSGPGLVGCYDARSGRLKWARQLSEFGGSTPNWGYAESVLIYDNLAIVTPGGENCIVALDKTSGKPVWASQGFKAGAQYSSCYAFTCEGVPMIVNGTQEGIVCVDPKSGRPLWSNPFSARNTANCPTPVFSDGYVFWANGYGKGGICMKVAVNRGRVSAEEAWTTKDMVCHHGGYIVHEGHIYGNHNNGWVCLDLRTGAKKWEERAVGKGSVCYADGMLYLFGEKGGQVGLATCSPDGLAMKGSFSVQGEGPSWAHPVVIGGRLYVRYDTHLYCYDVRSKG